MIPDELHIALVGPLPPPSGGMANQTRQLARLLEKERVNVTVIQVNPPYRPSWVVNIKFVRAFFRIVPYLIRLWRETRKVQLVHVMANSGWSWHLFAAPAIWIASMRNVPVIVNYRGGEAKSFFESQFRWIDKSLRRVTTVIVPSGFLKEVFRDFGVEAKIVPNIIDNERFSSYKNVNKAASNGVTLLISRNLEPIYDIATAIRAFSIVRENVDSAKLVVAGSGPEKERLEQLSEELGITEYVLFTGRVDNDRMNELYRNADIMLNSSLVDNMPNSILEALASGVPVVSTNVGGIPYLVEDGRTALLVDAANPEKMAEKVVSLLNDEDLKADLSSAGLELIQQFRWCNIKDMLFLEYERAVNPDSVSEKCNG